MRVLYPESRYYSLCNTVKPQVSGEQCCGSIQVIQNQNNKIKYTIGSRAGKKETFEFQTNVKNKTGTKR